jgi:hypothetical protein
MKRSSAAKPSGAITEAKDDATRFLGTGFEVFVDFRDVGGSPSLFRKSVPEIEPQSKLIETHACKPLSPTKIEAGAYPGFYACTPNNFPAHLQILQQTH